MYNSNFVFNKNRPLFVFDSYASIFLLFVVVFYLPTISGRLLDLFYGILIVLSLKYIKLSYVDEVVLSVSIVNTAVLTIFGLIRGNYEPYYSYFIFRFILLYLVYIKILTVYKHKTSNIILILLLINSIAVILDYLHIPQFVDFFRLIKAEQLYLEYRASGLFTGYYTAGIMISALICHVYFNNNIFAFIIAAIFGSIAIFMAGRSGFIVLLVFLCYIFIISLNKRMLSLKFVAAIMIIVSILFGFLQFAIHTLNDTNIIHTYNMFLEIFNLFQFQIEGSSNEPLFRDMYYLSDNIYDYIIGTNAKPFMSYIGVKSDSGYIQLLYGYGIICATMYLFCMYVLYKYSTSYYAKYLFIIMFIMSIKGSLFYSYTFMDYIFIIISMDIHS